MCVWLFLLAEKSQISTATTDSENLESNLGGGQKQSKTCGCIRKWWYPQIIHFNKDFHYRSSILGSPYFWKHPCLNLSNPDNDKNHPKCRWGASKKGGAKTRAPNVPRFHVLSQSCKPSKRFNVCWPETTQITGWCFKYPLEALQGMCIRRISGSSSSSGFCDPLCWSFSREKGSCVAHLLTNICTAEFYKGRGLTRFLACRLRYHHDTSGDLFQHPLQPLKKPFYFPFYWWVLIGILRMAY